MNEYLEKIKKLENSLNFQKIVEDYKFNTSRIADLLQQVFKWKTLRDSDELFFYNGYFYEPHGEKKVKEIINKWLQENYTTYRVNEIIENLKVRTYCDRNEEKGLFCLENGLLLINARKLLPFSHEKLVTRKLPVEFNPTADCPKCKKFFSEVLREEDIPVLQELFGYCLYDSMPFQKAFLLVGDGANGKSTVLQLLTAMLGKENISAIPLHELDTNRFSIGQLYGKLANIFADLPDRALYQTGKFKMLVGSDPINAEKKFKDNFVFINTTKLIFSCNKIPETKDTTDAFFRRWVFLQFPNVFSDTDPKTNKNILVSLTTKEELSGLLNWSLDGLVRLLQQSGFSNSKHTNELRDYYERMSSPVAAFVKDCIENSQQYTIDPVGWVKKDELYASFVDYCKEKKLPACASNIFAKQLPQYCPHVRATRHLVDGRQVNCWDGICYVPKISEQIENYI